MDLDTIRLHCERMIDWRRGEERAWTSAQMLSIVSDLQRIMENQRTDPHLADQLARALEELRAMYAENQRLREGRKWETFRMADGTQVMGEYAWVGDVEFFEDMEYDADEPFDVIKETWKLLDTETLHFAEREPDEDDDDIEIVPGPDTYGPPDHLPER